MSYADTDAAGVLHHARYIELAERGYFFWMKQRDLSFRKLGRDHNLTLVVYDIAARYRVPVQLEDEIQIVTKLQVIDRIGLEWKTLMLKDGQQSFSMLTKIACVDKSSKTIISVPDFLISKLASEVETDDKVLQPAASATPLRTGPVLLSSRPFSSHDK